MNAAKDWMPNTEGVFFDLPEQVYRSAPGVNVTSLKPLADSPKKYRYAQDHPKARTPAMVFGTCVHAILLEPERMAELVVSRPAQWDSFRTKEAKAWRDAQTAMVVSTEDLEEMHNCAAAVKYDPKAAWILSRSKTEVSVFRRHPGTGLLLKARLDLPFTDLEERTAVADTKKVQSVRPGLFSKAIGDFMYHMQGAFYADMIGATSFYFIAVEESAPHEVAIYRLSDASLARGRALYESLLTRLVACQTSGRWPGATEDSDAIMEIEEPTWAQRGVTELEASK